MYSFLDLGAFLLQGKKIQESAIQYLVKFVRLMLCFTGFKSHQGLKSSLALRSLTLGDVCARLALQDLQAIFECTDTHNLAALLNEFARCFDFWPH